MVKKKKGWGSQRSFDKTSGSYGFGSASAADGATSEPPHAEDSGGTGDNAKDDKGVYGFGTGSKSGLLGGTSKSPMMSYPMSSPSKDSPFGDAVASSPAPAEEPAVAASDTPNGALDAKADGKSDDKTEAKSDEQAEAKSDDKTEAKSDEKTGEQPKGEVFGAPGERTTIVGPTIIIRGKLQSDENLIVRGRIEAEITSSKDLLLEATGIVNADMRIKSVTISGIVVGDIHAQERVKLAPEARVVGDIYTPRLVVEDGASFRGRVEMEGLEHLVGVRPQAEQPVAVTDGELGEGAAIVDADAANNNDETHTDVSESPDIYYDENVG